MNSALRCKVKRRDVLLMIGIGCLGLFGAMGAPAQAPDSSSGQNPPSAGGQDPASGAAPSQNPGTRRRAEGGPRPLFGKITAIRDGAIELATPDGQTLTVKLTSQTEFRKDREPAKATDFKVGDMVTVRGDENGDHSVTARIVGARTGGPGGSGGGGRQMGTLGKDYVVGEVKSIDAPRLNVLRPDNVTQTVELNEETSLRKGRDSITMADIQVGDHVIARGAMEKDVFVPKEVMVMNAEQWKRMQEMRQQYSGQKAPGSEATPPKP
jgi:Domain of unknown function (DUF5666)